MLMVFYGSAGNNSENYLHISSKLLS